MSIKPKHWTDDEELAVCHLWPYGTDLRRVKGQCEICESAVSCFPVTKEAAEKGKAHIVCRICFALLYQEDPDNMKFFGHITDNKWPDAPKVN